MPTVEELRAALRKAEQDERLAKIAAMNAVKPVYQMTVKPAPARNTWPDQLFDTSCCYYTVIGTVANKDEMLAAGWSEDEVKTRDGSMRCLFNKATGKIVCNVGGGRIWLDKQNKADAVAAFIVNHPEGGDVTHIFT